MMVRESRRTADPARLDERTAGGHHERAQERPKEPSSDELEYVDRTHINLGGGTYRWLDLKRFRFGAECDDVAALGALLRHVRYRDHYATDDAHWEPSENLHGPYWLDRLGADAFEPINPAGARELLHHWADEWGATSEKALPGLTDAADRVIDAATTVFRLRDLRAASQHEWGWVLGEFHELVALNRPDGILTLMVASDD